MYICTEDTFPSKRLTQLVQTFPLQFIELEKIKFGDNIYIQHVSDFVGIYFSVAITALVLLL